MRIAYLTNARIPTEKAHGLQIMKTLEALALRGEEVSLVVPKRKNSITENPFTFYGLRVEFPIVYLAKWLAPLEKFSEALYFPGLRFFFGLQAFFYALHSRAEVIYTRDIVLALFLSLLTSRKVIYEDHEPKKSNRAVYLFLLRHITKKVIVAENLADLYRAGGVADESFRIIPNGVDLSESGKGQSRISWKNFNLDPERPVVLYVGSLYEWKGVYTLLLAAPHISGQVVFIGSTGKDLFLPQVEEVQAFNVRQLDFMPHTQVIDLMAQADVLVLPNTAKEERSERFTTPLKLFEYMASGVPIVASRIPSFAPYLRNEENSKLCEADNPEALAQAISWVLADRERASELARRAQKEVRSYTWDARAAKIVQFITA